MNALAEVSTNMREMAARSSGPIWGGAYTMAAQVIEASTTPEQAIKSLRKAARDFNGMSCACIFTGAANQLKAKLTPAEKLHGCDLAEKHGA